MVAMVYAVTVGEAVSRLRMLPGPDTTIDAVVVGAGAIGGTVGARLARDGHSVLFCDADPEHVAAINERGLTIEGPLEQFTVQAPAVSPDDLPTGLGGGPAGGQASTHHRGRRSHSRHALGRAASSFRFRTG